MSDNIFDERESGFEAKFKFDQETRFKAQARRNKLFGLWVAELLGMAEGSDEAVTYALEVVQADFAAPGEDDVLDKVCADLEANGQDADRISLGRKLDHFFAVAMTQLGHEFPTPLGDDHPL